MSRRRLLVAGGGVGAVEALLALRELAPETFDVTLLAPGPALVLAPESVAEATGGPTASRFDLAAIAADLGVKHVPDALDAIDVSERRATTRDGTTLDYDALLLALGAMPGPALPGALRFGGMRDVPAVRSALERTAEAACPTIAFVATGGVGWTLPLYELATLVAARFEDEGRERSLIVVTPEAEPLSVFGHTASRQVAHHLTQLGIHVKTATMAETFENGHLWLAAGGSIEADVAIALPEPRGPEVPGPSRRPERIRPGRPLRAGRRGPVGLGRRGHDGSPAQAGRAGHPAGRRGRTLDRRVGGRARGAPALRAGAPGAAARRLATVPPACRVLDRPEHIERTTAVVARRQDRRRAPGALPARSPGAASRGSRVRGRLKVPRTRSRRTPAARLLIELVARRLAGHEQLARRQRDVPLEPVEQGEQRLAAARRPEVGGEPAQRDGRRADPGEPDPEGVGALAHGRRRRFAHLVISPCSMA